MKLNWLMSDIKVDLVRGKSSAVFLDAVMDEIHDLKTEFGKKVTLFYIPPPNFHREHSGLGVCKLFLFTLCTGTLILGRRARPRRVQLERGRAQPDADCHFGKEDARPATRVPDGKWQFKDPFTLLLLLFAIVIV